MIHWLLLSLVSAFESVTEFLGLLRLTLHLQSPNLDLILAAIEFSKKYRKVLIQTGCAALLYNVVSRDTCGARTVQSTLGAVLSMLASFSIMLLSVSRLSKVQEVRE
jgi:hypothetical protein